MAAASKRGCVALYLAIMLQIASFSAVTSTSSTILLNGNINISLIGESVADESIKEEIFMESHASQRLLAGDNDHHINLKTLVKQPVCNEKIYGSCLKGLAGQKDAHCTYYNKCRGK